MDLDRPTLQKWLLVAVAIVAVVSMIVVVYQTTRPPATPQIDPQFSRSKQGPSRGRDHGGGLADPASQGDPRKK